MKIYHNSRIIKYRHPFGAVSTRCEVSLTTETDFQPDFMWLRLWRDGESLVPMVKSGGNTYSVKVTMPEDAGLVWYYFVAEKDGKRVYCCKGERGEGVTMDFCNESSWQITVFEKDFKTPDWFKNSIIYQIFPDRFFRKGEGNEIFNKKSEYIIHEDWYEPVIFNRHPFEEGPACNDFYGGNFRGITEKLPYLKALGISAIYLNPIFEAFSNHRYDTGDYSKIDPLLGNVEDFEILCQKAESMGIKIILDGVFSHTGSDSVYFNKYGNYGEDCGAYRHGHSQFRKWYQWNENGYESWWGCSNLPNINEMEPTYIDYILTGSDAIIKKWLRHGAFGWRLDVADELPDEFIKILRNCVKTENPQAVIIGEVWEDASNKESYGNRREYLLGAELDSVMNYPFRDNVIAFLTEGISAEVLDDGIMTIAENYPKESLYAAMNILGTHDTIRVKNLLSGQQIDENLSTEDKVNFKLAPHAETLAIKRLKLAVFMQMTFVGVPCIYYGDEIGMQGLGDPCNRMPYSWRCVDNELLEHYKKLTALRNSKDCLRCGGFEVVYAKGGIFAYTRKISEGKDAFGNKAKNGFVLCVVNRDAVPCDFTAEIQDVSSGEGVFGVGRLTCRSGKVTVSISGFGAELFAIG